MLYIGLYAQARHYCKICLAVSKEQLLQKYPEQKEAVEFFVQRAPGGNLKYVEWELKVLISRQALKEEIADVVELFNKFHQRLEKKDIYQYQPQELASLREKLFAIKEEQQGRRQQRQEKVQKRYQNEPEAIACGHKIIFDSEDLKCIQIMNKAASMHYGIGTKWCITMKDQSYWEDYDKSNVVFFFLFNKKLEKSSRYYKVAFAYQRDMDNNIMQTDTFDAEDNQFDSGELAEKYADGLLNKEFPDRRTLDPYLNHDKIQKIHVEPYRKYLDELSKIYTMMLDIAKSYPKSLLARIYSDELSVDEVVKIYEQEKNPDIAKYLQKWLLGNIKDQKYEYIIMDLAKKSENYYEIEKIGKCKFPSVLDVLLNNIMTRIEFVSVVVDHIDSISLNKALSQAGIQKIFSWIRAKKQSFVKEEDDNDPGKERYESIEGKLLKLPNCPPNELAAYSKHQSSFLREQVAKNYNTPTEAIDSIIEGKDRASSAHYTALYNPNASENVLKAAFDRDPVDGLAIINNPGASPDLLRHIFNYFKRSLSIGNDKWNKSARIVLDETKTYYVAFFKNKNTPSDILEYLYSQISGYADEGQVSTKDFEIFEMLLANPNTPAQVIDAIHQSPYGANIMDMINYNKERDKILARTYE